MYPEIDIILSMKVIVDLVTEYIVYEYCIIFTIYITVKRDSLTVVNVVMKASPSISIRHFVCSTLHSIVIELNQTVLRLIKGNAAALGYLIGTLCLKFARSFIWLAPLRT